MPYDFHLVPAALLVVLEAHLRSFLKNGGGVVVGELSLDLLTEVGASFCPLNRQGLCRPSALLPKLEAGSFSQLNTHTEREYTVQCEWRAL